MRTKDRLKLECAAAVLAFCNRHPGDAPAAQDAEQRLAGVLRQAAVVSDQLQVARNDLDAVGQQRDRLTRAIKDRIDALIRLAAMAAAEPGADGLRLRASLRAAAPGVFLREARRVITAALDHGTLLLRYGMPPGMLQSLEADLAALAATNTRRTAITAVATAAAADLAALAGRAMQIVRHLDALNHIRFATGSELLAEWNGEKGKGKGEREPGRGNGKRGTQHLVSST
jgi:hypothetical protein